MRPNVVVGTAGADDDSAKNYSKKKNPNFRFEAME